MPISTASKVYDGFRRFTVTASIDKEGFLCGTVSHASMVKPVRFENTTEMVLAVESVLDNIGYFKPDRDIRWKGHCPASDGTEKKDKETKFDFSLSGRYNAGWQGYVTFGKERENFNSFLDFLEIIDKKLCSDMEQPLETIKDTGIFLERFFRGEGNIERIRSQKLLPWRQYGKGDRFSIRIRFLGNESVQGSLIWREGREEINFRSFLELLMCMEEAPNSFRIAYAN